MTRSTTPSSFRRRLERLEDRRVLAAVSLVPQEPIVASDHVWATTAVPADVDGDGDLDLVTSSALDHRVGWYPNEDGEGTFGQLRLISDDARESRMVRVVDLDGDGDLDVISANYSSNRVSWFENEDGQGNFGEARVVTEFAINATSVDAADIDGDGDPDLISTSSGAFDSDVSWYRNDGSGNFGPQLVITTDVAAPYSAVLADIDGDGDPDVLSSSLADDKIAWYENTDGAGNFGPQIVIDRLFLGANEVIAADFDGDGDLDVAAGSSDPYDPQISWYENTDGNGSFTPAKLISDRLDGVESLAAVDLDGDEDLDLVSATFYDDQVVWFENLDGVAGFSSARLITDNGEAPTSAIAGDLDGDGDLDLALSSLLDDTIAWVRNENGSFSDRIVVSEFGAAGVEVVRSADLDGDGDLDTLAASVNDDTFAWFENLDGHGSFGPKRVIDDNANGAINIEAADLDGDGDLDVLGSSSGNGSVTWYENIDGKGDFSAPVLISSSVIGTESSKAADLDGDGDLDILAAATSVNTSAVLWFENQGNGLFRDAQTIWVEDGTGQDFRVPVDIEAADIDEDNDLDLVVASAIGDVISWFENTDGLGSFGSLQIISNDVNGPLAIDIDDIDGDGHLDILTVSLEGDDEIEPDDTILWFSNPNGNGQFSEPQIISRGVHAFPEAIELVDLDSDGDLDAVVASFLDDTLAWYENLDGNGRFGEQQVIDSDSFGSSAIVAADIDGDGDADLVNGMFWADRITWYRNESPLDTRGDVNQDGQVDVDDVDLLCSQIRSGDHVGNFDLTGDSLVDRSDLDEMIRSVIGSTYGDATLDGVFDSSDLVQVFVRGEYEDGIADNSTWADGDWNCDGEFDSGDLVEAFSAGGYISASRSGQPRVGTAEAAAALASIFADEDHRQRPVRH